MWDTERQLVLARRGEVEMDTSLKNMNRDTAQYVLKSEHESMLKKREEGLVADMRENNFRLVIQTCAGRRLRPSKRHELNIAE